MKTFISDCNELLSSIPVCTGDTARLAFRLGQAVNRLQAVVSQADTQFNRGYKYASFDKKTISQLNNPHSH